SILITRQGLRATRRRTRSAARYMPPAKAESTFLHFVLLLLKHRLHSIHVHFSRVSHRGHGSLQVGTHNFARDDPCWHSHHCAVARHVRDDKRISAHDHVVAYSHPTHHFASRAEIDIVADRRPPGPTYARDADALVNGATMADALGENKNPHAIVDD